ncbi:hypothetical protein F4776DRAFT_677549 [Hypoxylon sp. NC0597]|nr:hypothetical protein F4776DRAFT_677549 [Hypoxylon sp. NC0597]
MASKGTGSSKGKLFNVQEDQDQKPGAIMMPNTDNAGDKKDDIEDINPSNIVEHASRYRIGLYTQGALIQQHLQDLKEMKNEYDDMKENVYDSRIEIMNILRSDLRSMENTLNSMSQQRLRAKADAFGYEMEVRAREEIPAPPTREMSPQVLERLGLGDLAELVSTEITKRFGTQYSLRRIDADVELARRVLAVMKDEAPVSALDDKPTGCSAKLVSIGDRIRKMKILDEEITTRMSAAAPSASTSTAKPGTSTPDAAPQTAASMTTSEYSVSIAELETASSAELRAPFNTPTSTPSKAFASASEWKDAIPVVSSGGSNPEAPSKASTAAAVAAEASSEAPTSAEQPEAPMTAKERQRKKKSAKRAERRRRQRAEALNREEDQK